jgi:hypothetical protein
MRGHNNQSLVWMSNEDKELQVGHFWLIYKAKALSKHGNFGVLAGPKGGALDACCTNIWVGNDMASLNQSRSKGESKERSSQMVKESHGHLPVQFLTI